MKALQFGVIVASVALLSCSNAPGPALSVSELKIYAPLPGSATFVAYMALQNNGATNVEINGASSPSFGRIEMHETVIADGIARMQAIDTLIIPAGSAVKFAPGGRHLMLLNPQGELRAGQAITLRLHYGDAGLLLLQAPLLERSARAVQ